MDSPSLEICQKKLLKSRWQVRRSQSVSQSFSCQSALQLAREVKMAMLSCFLVLLQPPTMAHSGLLDAEEQHQAMDQCLETPGLEDF